MRHIFLIIASIILFRAQSVFSQSAVKIIYNDSDDSVIVVDPSYPEVEFPSTLKPLPVGIKEVSKERFKDDMAEATKLIGDGTNEDFKIEQMSQFTVGLSDDGPNISLKSAVLVDSHWEI